MIEGGLVLQAKSPRIELVSEHPRILLLDNYIPVSPGSNEKETCAMHG